MVEFQLSAEAVEKIKSFEGLRLKAYQDSAGVWTIGYGHTRGVCAGMVITKERADIYLRQDLAPCERYVNSLGVTKSASQHAALVDFCYNLGTGSLMKSTLLKKIKLNRPIDEIQKEFKKWVFAGGKKLAGLVARRHWEAEMWGRR